MITLEVFLVIVDLKCVYTEKDTLSDAKFDPATHICCQKSGVHKDFSKARKWTVVGVRNILQCLELFTVNKNE